MRRWGWVLLIIGGLTLWGAFLFPITLEAWESGGPDLAGHTANLDLIGQRAMLQIAGLAEFLAGAVFLAGHHIAKAVKGESDPEPSDPGAGQY